MKRFGLLLLAASSLLTSTGAAATRPHYGGTLRMMMQGAPASLDPTDPALMSSWTGRNLTRAVFDTLLILDDRGMLQPSLATAWQADSGNQRWVLSLRNDVSFHDGSPLTAEAVASSLRAANPQWRVFTSGAQVVIETTDADPELPVELSLPRNGIAKRTPKLVGTGPFAIEEWIPGSKLTLVARDDSWRGRAFVDRITVEMGKKLREQEIALDLGKTDLIEVAPEQARRAAAGGRQIARSSPLELIALVFTRDPQSAQEARIREALSLSIDRNAINNVLLQGGGGATGSVLPNWITGYGFLFSPDKDLTQARQIRTDIPQSISWTLAYDAVDPLARVIAERIVLNAKDAGIALRATSFGTFDVRLMRVPISTLNGGVALEKVAESMGLSPVKTNDASVEALYAEEKALLKSGRVIPLLHVPVSYAMAPNVKNWTEGRDASWCLGDVWLGTEKP